MEVTIKTMLGSTFPLPVTPAMTLREVKQQIKDKEGFPIEKQRLIYQGSELENDQATFGSLGLPEACTLHLALRLQSSPVAAAAAAAPVPAATATTTSSGLPPGWEMRTAADGRSGGIALPK